MFPRCTYVPEWYCCYAHAAETQVALLVRNDVETCGHRGERRDVDLVRGDARDLCVAVEHLQPVDHDVRRQRVREEDLQRVRLLCHPDEFLWRRNATEPTCLLDAFFDLNDGMNMNVLFVTMRLSVTLQPLLRRHHAARVQTVRPDVQQTDRERRHALRANRRPR